ALEEAQAQYVNYRPPISASDFRNSKDLTVLDGKLVKKIILDPEAYWRLGQLQNIVAEHGEDVSFKSLRKLRQVWDTAVAQGNGYAGKSLTEGGLLDAKKEGASAIREELDKASPDIKKLNGEYNFWRNVDRVI